MKKLLAVLLASALFVPAMAGSIFNSVETIGEIQTIGTLSSDMGNGKNRDVSNRVLFGLGMELVEDVKANITFVNKMYWGSSDYNSPYGEQPSVNSYLDKVQVAEANVALSNVFNAFDLKVGRQFYGDESSAVMYFGPTHYRGRFYNDYDGEGLFADSNSLDAAVLTYNSEEYLVNVIYAKVWESGINNGDRDQSLLGFDAKYFVNESLSLQAYLYDLRTAFGAGPGNSIRYGLWGLKAGYADDGMGLGLEFAKNYFDYDDQPFFYNNMGWMVKADASMKLAMDNMDVTPRITYLHAEKDMATLGNYSPGIVFGGGRRNVLDPFGSMNFSGGSYGNARILNIGADVKYDKFTFALDYLNIKYGPSDNAEWFGNEIDLMVKYAMNEYVELHTGVGYVTNLGQYWIGPESTGYAAQMGMIVKF